MHGIRQAIGGRYDMEIAVMIEMHWSNADYLDAPADMVEEIAYRLQRENHWLHEKKKRDDAMSKQRREKSHGR